MPPFPRPFFESWCRGVSHTPSERLRMEANDWQTGYVLGRIRYAPTYTDQKFDSYLLDESQTRQVLGCMQYAPTYTDQKFDSTLDDESQTRWVLGCMSLRSTPPQRETLKICMDARKTRRGLDENGHIHRKPGGDWMKMAIFTENPAGIGRIWSYLPKTRRGLDENGHIYRKPGEDWTKMAIFTENLARIG